MSLISFVFVHSVLLGFIYLRRNLQCYNKNALNLMESDIHINSLTLKSKNLWEEIKRIFLLSFDII